MSNKLSCIIDTRSDDRSGCVLYATKRSRQTYRRHMAQTGLPYQYNDESNMQVQTSTSCYFFPNDE